ncbi:MAG TPA: hypothetical protein VFE46_04480, partial [Pirellulales bacterium]|nr:hypothetical protein [Pirellulales bacterium]
PPFDFGARPMPILLDNQIPAGDVAPSVSAMGVNHRLLLSMVDEVFSRSDDPANMSSWEQFDNLGDHQTDAHFCEIEALVSSNA